jgi:Mg2+-importing ATPase
MRSSELFGDSAYVDDAGHRARLNREIKVSPQLVAVSGCNPATALHSLDCTDAGLDDETAGARLRRCGANQIARERRVGVLHELINRTKNPLNGLLLTLSVVSYFLGDVRAAVIIASMVILSIITAFIQEHRSNQAAAKLRALVKTTASVKRRGMQFRISGRWTCCALTRPAR